MCKHRRKCGNGDILITQMNVTRIIMIEHEWASWLLQLQLFACAICATAWQYHNGTNLQVMYSAERQSQ